MTCSYLEIYKLKHYLNFNQLISLKGQQYKHILIINETPLGPES